jgi:hypothetical protein
MELMQTFSIKLDANYKIIDINQQFIDFFGLNGSSVINDSIPITAQFFSQLQRMLAPLANAQKKSVIILTNNIFQQKIVPDAIFILYLTLEKITNNYVINIVNWLNWLHNINKSIEYSYAFIKKFNQTTCKSRFKRISDIHCFKALQPLLMHMPHKFKINPLSIYDIMHLFVKKDTDKIISKDYSRNVLSRLQTSLRKEIGLNNVEIIDLIKDDELLIIKQKNQICISNTVLHEDMIFFVEGDKLLEWMMQRKNVLATSPYRVMSNGVLRSISNA